MRAITVEPGVANSAKLDEMPEPAEVEGGVLVKTVAIGVCGTDLEIARGDYGWAPPSQRRLILGHESIGHVIAAPTSSGLHEGDWVVGIVRRPDPVPCPNCAVDEWDMCSNGQYTERGIKSLHGFAAERYRGEARYLVRVEPKLGFLGVLLEPTSVVAKAWEQAARIGARSRWSPRRVLVTGAGPIGLLAALLGVQRGLEVHVFDRVTEGTKPALVRDLGATYHSGQVDDLRSLPAWDLVFECTGAPQLLFGAIRAAAPDGIVCLTGVSSGGHVVSVDPGSLNREIVLENNVVFGSVNANRRHYEQAAAALAKADADWLARLITRKVPALELQSALVRQPDDIKTVITFE
jgi:glucose 1-dehydrogenase